MNRTVISEQNLYLRWGNYSSAIISLVARKQSASSYRVLDGCILALHSRLNHAGVSKDEHARSADEPEERAKRRGPPEKRQTDDKKASV